LEGRGKYILCEVSGGNCADVLSTKEGGKAINMIVAILEIAQALGKFDIVLHAQDGDTLDALGD
jgi:hypothetical protein